MASKTNERNLVSSLRSSISLLTRFDTVLSHFESLCQYDWLVLIQLSSILYIICNLPHEIDSFWYSWLILIQLTHFDTVVIIDWIYSYIIHCHLYLYLPLSSSSSAIIYRINTRIKMRLAIIINIGMSYPFIISGIFTIFTIYCSTI